jgi:hypothetical protein
MKLLRRFFILVLLCGLFGIALSPAQISAQLNGVSPATLSFTNLYNASGISLAFPGGGRVVPTYELGLPLGLEKAVLES